MTDNDRRDDEREGLEDQQEPTGKPSVDDSSRGSESPDGGPAFEGDDVGADMPGADTDVFDMLRAAIGLFAQEAWIALGVQARYGSSETEVDLRCARIAIDTTRMLIEQLGDEATDAERREFDQLLTNLRINFVRRNSAHEEESREED